MYEIYSIINNDKLNKTTDITDVICYKPFVDETTNKWEDNWNLYQKFSFISKL